MFRTHTLAWRLTRARTGPRYNILTAYSKNYHLRMLLANFLAFAFTASVSTPNRGCVRRRFGAIASDTPLKLA